MRPGIRYHFRLPRWMLKSQTLPYDMVRLLYGRKEGDRKLGIRTQPGQPGGAGRGVEDGMG